MYKVFHFVWVEANEHRLQDRMITIFSFFFSFISSCIYGLPAGSFSLYSISFFTFYILSTLNLFLHMLHFLFVFFYF
jgi:hypothetical protein